MTKKNTSWGGRFTQSVSAIASKFSNSIDIDSVLAEKDIIGSIAYAESLQEAGVINLQTNGSNTRLHIASDGDVGINQTSPESTLHVTGNVLVQNNIGNNLTIRSTVNNGNDPNFIFEKSLNTAIVW